MSTSKDQNLTLQSIYYMILSEKKKLIMIVVCFTLFGLIKVVTTPNEYRTKTKLLPISQQSLSVSGSISSLASLAGVNLSSLGGESDLHPTIYPVILNSTDFKYELLNKEFKVKSIEDKISFRAYLTDHTKTHAYSSIIKGVFTFIFEVKDYFFSDLEIDESGYDKYLYLSKDDLELTELIEERIVVSLEDDRTIVLNVKLQDAEMSAEVADFVLNYLTDYLIDYKTSKIGDNLVFIEKQKLTARSNFLKAEVKLTEFLDRNKNITSAKLKVIEDHLRSDFDLYKGLYNDLTSQLEQTKIAQEENKPAYKILEPITIASKKSEPKRIISLMLYMLSGFLIGVGAIVFVKTQVMAKDI